MESKFTEAIKIINGQAMVIDLNLNRLCGIDYGIWNWHFLERYLQFIDFNFKVDYYRTESNVDGVYSKEETRIYKVKKENIKDFISLVCRYLYLVENSSNHNDFEAWAAESVNSYIATQISASLLEKNIAHKVYESVRGGYNIQQFNLKDSNFEMIKEHVFELKL